MAAFTAAYLSSTLREVVKDDIRPQVKRSHFMWDKFFQKEGKDVNERGRFQNIYVTPSGIGTFVGEQSALPLAVPEEEARMKSGYTAYYKAFSFTARALAQMKQGPAGVADVKTRLNRYKTDISVEMSRWFYGNGDARLAVVKTGSSPYGEITTGAGGNLYTAVEATDGHTMGATFLHKNDRVQFVGLTDATNPVDGGGTYRVNGGASAYTSVVTSVVGNRVYFDVVPSDVVNNDIVVPVGGYGQAMKGLEYHVSSSTAVTYQNLSRSTYPDLKAIIYDLAGAAFSYGAITILNHLVRFRRDKGPSKDLITCSIGIHAKADMMLQSMKRATMSEETLKVGATSIQDAWGNTWEIDDEHPEDRVYRLREEDFEMNSLMPLDYVDTGNGGNMLLENATAADGTIGHKHVYGGWWVWMGDFFCLEPRNQMAMTGAETAGTLRSYLNR